MPPRVKKIRHDEETRAKIQAAQIINRFQACVMGEVELSAAQVSAGKTLLDKALPNLQAVDMTAEHTHDLSDPLKELFNSINERGKRLGPK